jgi:hypothetical protein
MTPKALMPSWAKHWCKVPRRWFMSLDMKEYFIKSPVRVAMAILGYLVK